MDPICQNQGTKTRLSAQVSFLPIAAGHVETCVPFGSLKVCVALYHKEKKLGQRPTQARTKNPHIQVHMHAPNCPTDSFHHAIHHGLRSLELEISDNSIALEI